MSDLCATIDARLAALHAAQLPLRVLEPPVRIPGAPLSLVWHDRTDHDPARRWLREQVRAASLAGAEATRPRGRSR